jgi:hypothetical protein
MKGKRTVIDINDFSGGLVTNIPITSLDTKASPDCMNVFPEGTKLKKRLGTSNLNSSTVGTNKKGNGIFNWVKNASEQLLMAAFDNVLYKMDISGSSWDGTFDTVSAHATSGTPFSDSIVHFNTYAGTLIFTTELRNKPQKMLALDTSHFDIESGGSGTAPLGKYNQVWKEHVWILNIGAGGLLTEDFDTISSWTDNDTGTAASTQASFQGLETAKFVSVSGDTASDAIRTRDIGDLTDDYTIEVKTYFDTIESVSATSTSNGYVLMHFDNGATRLETRWSDDGLEIYDGAAWNEVGVDIISEDTWNTWKFVVSGGTAASSRVDVLKDGVFVGVGLDMSSASATTASDGQIQITATGSTGTGVTCYIDYMYINSSSVKTPTTPNLVAEPAQPLTHFKLNDNASNTTITDDGSDGTNAVMYTNSTTLDTDQVSDTGKIGNAISFAVANSHNVQFGAGTLSVMTNNATGTICCWVKPVGVGTTGRALFSLGDTNAGNSFTAQLQTDDNVSMVINSGGEKMNMETTSATAPSGLWTHVAIVQAATNLFYVNGTTVGTTINSGTGDEWIVDAPTLDNGRLGCRNFNSGGNEKFMGGLIDDFRYYSTALTSDQISSIYAEGAGCETQAVTSREGTTIVIGTYSYEFTNDGTYATAITQSLASGSDLAGVASVLGMWVYGTNNATYKLRINDGTNDIDSAVLTANGTWQYQTFSFTPISGAATVKMYFISTSAATFFLDQVSIEIDSTEVTDDKSDRIQRSAVGTLDDWDGTDSGSNDVVTPGDVGLTGSFILNDRMYVTKTKSIHRFTYTGSTPLVDIKQIRTGVGTKSPRSIKNVVLPGQGEVVFFLGSDKRLYAFDGFDSTVINKNIQFDNGISSIYFNNINSQALDKVFAVLHDSKPWYELFVPIGNSTVPDFSIVYDYEAKSFWPFNNRNMRYGNTSDNGAGVGVNYVQDNTTGFAVLLDSTNADVGSSIDAYWLSPKIGDPTILSRMDEVNIITNNVAASPTFGWREDFNTAYTTKTLSSSSNLHNYNPKLLDNYIQFRIADDSTTPQFEVWNIRTLSESIGHGK